MNVRLPAAPIIDWRGHEGRFWVDKSWTIDVSGTTGIDASCPLALVPAKVYSPNRQRSLGLGRGKRAISSTSEVAAVGARVTWVKVGDRIIGTIHPRRFGGPITADYLTDRLGANLDVCWRIARS